MKKISSEKRFEIVRFLRCGITGYEIAEKTGVSLSTICKIRKEEEQKGFDIWHRPGVVSKSIN